MSAPVTGLYLNTNPLTLLTRYVNITPKKDVIKVENRTLDGQFHVQTIGTGADLLAVTLHAENETARALVDSASASATYLKIVIGSTYWIGIIRGNLEWEKIAGTFKTTFDFLVQSTGAVV